MARKIPIQAFIRQGLNRRTYGAELHWENRSEEIWRLLYYHDQVEQAVFEAWDITKPRKEQRKLTVKSLFHQTLNYMVKQRLIEELEKDDKYRRFRFMQAETVQPRRGSREIIDHPNMNRQILIDLDELNNPIISPEMQQDTDLFEFLNNQAIAISNYLDEEVHSPNIPEVSLNEKSSSPVHDVPFYQDIPNEQKDESLLENIEREIQNFMDQGDSLDSVNFNENVYGLV